MEGLIKFSLVIFTQYNPTELCSITNSLVRTENLLLITECWIISHIYLHKIKKIWPAKNVKKISTEDFAKFTQALTEYQREAVSAQLCIRRVLEQQLFDRVPKPYCYISYVDDTFVCFSSGNESLKFYQCLNNLHPSLSYSMEAENSNMLPFLDVLVKKGPSSFVTSIHRKLTFTGLYIPKSKRFALIVGLKQSFKRSLKYFLKNGYREKVISRNIRCKSNTSKMFGPPKCPVYVKLLGIEPASQFFVDKIYPSSYVVFTLSLPPALHS